MISRRLGLGTSSNAKMKTDTKNILHHITDLLFNPFTGNRLYAIPYIVAKSVVDKVEYTQLNKVEFTDNKESIKETCIPLKVDRLGNIIELNGKEL